MRNWKTTLFGVILAAGVIGKPLLVEKRAPTLTDIVETVAALGLGASSKDKDVTGAGSAARRVEN